MHGLQSKHISLRALPPLLCGDVAYVQDLLLLLEVSVHMQSSVQFPKFGWNVRSTLEMRRVMRTGI